MRMATSNLQPLPHYSISRDAVVFAQQVLTSFRTNALWQAYLEKPQYCTVDEGADSAKIGLPCNKMDKRNGLGVQNIP